MLRTFDILCEFCLVILRDVVPLWLNSTQFVRHEVTKNTMVHHGYVTPVRN